MSMLCCVGLFGGFAVGQYLGGPWTFAAPAAGFGLGLVADMKMMKGMHKKAEPKEHPDGHEPAPPGRSAPCCGIASRAGRPSWLTRLLGEKAEREMTLAEIRKTYATDAADPPPPAGGR